MKLRQLNAKISGIMIILHLIHIAIVVYMYLTVQYFYLPTIIASWAANIATIVHVIISIILVVRHDSGLSVAYPKINRRVLVQRISAAVMLVLLPAHLKAYKFLSDFDAPISRTKQLSIIVITILFFAAVFVHVAVSLSRAVITFCDTREIAHVKNMDKIVYVVCALLYALTLYAVLPLIIFWQVV